MMFSKIAANHVVRLGSITLAAVMIHGYHLGADDAAIYVPGIKKAADPSLFPFGSEFFMSHAHLSLFPNLVGGSARLTHLPVDLIIFLWHILSIYLLVAGCYRVLGCFASECARWCGVALVAALLSVPVAGTALLLMDPYLTARSLSTPLTLFAIAEGVNSRWKRALSWLLATALIHPQMACYAAAFLAIHAVLRERENRQPQFAGSLVYAGMPLILFFHRATGAAREALFSRTYFFVFNWTWYEWFGVFAPLALLYWFAKTQKSGTERPFASLCRALVFLGILGTGAALILEISPQFENFARLQPMRSLHLIYVVFFAILGALLGDHVLKRSVARWVGLFASLAVTMWLVQHATYAGSPHIEWPGGPPHNDWVSAFLWVRNNTPKNAIFALEPRYMLSRGEDAHGFRAIAERSALADDVKDSGAASLFPALADEWETEVRTESQQFAARDFHTLMSQYHVTWVLTRRPRPGGLTCPYKNREVAVCRVSQ